MAPRADRSSSRPEHRGSPQKRRAHIVTTASEPTLSPTTRFVGWLTPSRLRAQALVLALCLWGVFAIDFATTGLFDRAGNIKFQDFLPFYISAKLVAQH